MRPLEFAVTGIGVWAPECAGWDAARAVLAGGVENAANNTNPQIPPPQPAILPPAERRRAPEAVRLALEVAQQACAMAGCDPRELPHVFASGYGDTAVTDYLCATLARAPRELSPTRFHQSVHNAAAGYWTIATGGMRASSALSAGEHSFAAALLEAALLLGDEAAPVLLAAYDVAAPAALEPLVPCRTPFAVALVLAPAPAPAPRVRLTAPVEPADALARAPTLLHARHRDNPAARSLPLLAALARREPGPVVLAAGAQWGVHLEMQW